MSDPSPQQKDIIAEGYSAMSVISCAGSGKTFTAVRRVDALRSLIGAGRGHVALLSFSNGTRQGARGYVSRRSMALSPASS